MKTIKFIAVLAMLSLSMSTMAQNAMQEKMKQNKAALKEKASKDAKTEAKRMTKEGWTVSPGGLPLEKQVDRLYMFLGNYDDDMNPLYIDGEGRGTAATYTAAHIQATELARMNLASKISSEATGIVNNLIANKMLADDQAASITTTMLESKSIFSQKLGRLQTPLVVTRELKNKNKEVMVRVVTKTSDIQKIAKDAVREELEKSGKKMNKELKSYFYKDYESFKDGARKEYDDFRKQALKEYTKFVREAWEEFGAEPPVPVPEDEKVEPMFAPGYQEETASFFTKLLGIDKKDPQKEADKKAKKEAKKRERTNATLTVTEVVAAPKPAPKQPQPLSEVVQHTEKPNSYMAFDVFGTQCRVRIGDNCRIRLTGLTGNEVADIIENEFVKPQFDNMLYDCLQERKEHNFSDWAYYQMLLALTNKFYGEHTNEATMVLGFLYSQSGYKMRYAHNGNKLYMLVATQYNMFDKAFLYIDGEWFYLLDNIKKDEKLEVCKAKFPEESPLSLQLSAHQKFAQNPLRERTITSLKNPDFSFTIKPNKNYVDFYETYPSSYTDDNFMTRWAMYANTPMEEGVTSQLYPPMREKLKGLSPLEAVRQLNWWVQGTSDTERTNPNQNCFLYAYDEAVWGQDRAFFGEETLFYPYCDCEDRAILLSHLVRDLVGLDVVLVYYPGHLAMAVNFPEEEGVEGDGFIHEGRRFTICDPTYLGSDVGQTMSTMVGKGIKAILLKRS